jgi:hypothetical protein
MLLSCILNIGWKKMRNKKNAGFYNSALTLQNANLQGKLPETMKRNGGGDNDKTR